MRCSHGFKDELPRLVKVAFELQHLSDNDPVPNLYFRTMRRAMRRWNMVADYSIMMLSMLAFSRSFQSMVEQCSEDIWLLIWSKIPEHHESIEYFAKARGLPWKDLLERYHDFTEYINSVQTLGEKFPDDEVPIEHPHSRVVPPSGGRLREPTSRQAPETAQIIINENIYNEELWRDASYPRPMTWPGMWPYPFDPMTRIPFVGYDEYCECCNSNIICACQITDFERYSEPLLELRDFGKRGNGIRTLKFMERGTILAEYLGEIVPNGSAYDESWSLDPVYGWEIGIEGPEFPAKNPLATIAAKRKGNWCRYVNHSCRNSLTGSVGIVGEKRRLIYWATRDILPFEELTVDYGDSYFTTPENPCRCGEDVCKHRAEDFDQSDTETDIEGEDD